PVKTTVPDLQALTPGARRILDAASGLFYERGITAGGADLIAEQSGVTKRQLYQRAGATEVLGAPHLLARQQPGRHLVDAAVGRPGLSALDRVTAPFAGVREWMTQSPRGCALINALAELPDPAHPAHRIAAEEKRSLWSLFARLAADAGITEAMDVAHRLVCLHQGALALRAALPTIDSVTVASQAARELVRSAAAGSTGAARG